MHNPRPPLVRDGVARGLIAGVLAAQVLILVMVAYLFFTVIRLQSALADWGDSVNTSVSESPSLP